MRDPGHSWKSPIMVTQAGGIREEGRINQRGEGTARALTDGILPAPVCDPAKTLWLGSDVNHN